MKYLVLFLISFNLYAIDYNIKVQDYKTSKIEREFNGTGLEAQSWMNKARLIMPKLGFKHQRFITDYADNPISPSDLNDHANVQCWDRENATITYRACTTKEVVVQEFIAAHQAEEVDIEGNPTGGMVDVEEVPEVKATSYEVPATYKLVITDITQQVADEQAEKDASELERTQLRNAINVFKNGNATNAQVQRAIAYILKRM